MIFLITNKLQITIMIRDLLPSILILASIDQYNHTIICVFFLYFENTFETKNEEEYKNVLGVLLSYGFLSLFTHLKGLLLLIVRRLYVLFDVRCEEFRRYFNNIIDRSLIFLVIRQKWRSHSFFGEQMAKKWRSKSLFGEKESFFCEMESLVDEEMAKKMAK